MTDKLVEALKSFGLSEKESRVYLCLMKYGPKTTGEMAKSLKTYRVDVQRMLGSLESKGMIVESARERPVVYSAVPIEDALDAVLAQCDYERKWMEVSKQPIIDMARQIERTTGNEHVNFKLLRGRKQEYALIERLIQSATRKIIFTSSFNRVYRLSLYELLDELIAASRRGVTVQCVTDVPLAPSRFIIEAMESIKVRDYDYYPGLFFIVVDSKETVTLIATNEDDFSVRADNHVAFWCNDPGYARRLEGTFKLIWEGAKEVVP
jgi:sugar-specific transcriptional regulator TrmB